MPDLRQTLNNYDLVLLKIIAEKWGLVLTATTEDDAVDEMVNWIVDSQQFFTMFEQITNDLKECLVLLNNRDGKLPWNAFIRRYGRIREMGIARRVRERPYDNPISITERLWYFGLIGRAFLNINDVLEEYAFIPDEFRSFINSEIKMELNRIDSPALRHEYRVVYAANDHILDHLTSFLAAIRSGKDPKILLCEFKQPSIPECRALLVSAKLVEPDDTPKPDAIKTFLASPRSDALLMIFTEWLNGTDFNELRLMPGIHCEGVWNNDPLKTRQVLVEQLRSLDVERWWSINTVIAQVKQNFPDFQRPAGDYESWIIRSAKTGVSLRGYEHWDQIDGSLIRYLITGPLHWLGITDLGSTRPGGHPEAFRFSNMAPSLLSGKVPDGLTEETGAFTVLRNGQITCPRYVPRAARYQLARFCEWLGVNDKGYLYQITVESLQRAIEQGLQIEQMLSLLSRYTRSSLPKSLVTSLQRWAKSGVQIAIKSVVILQVTDPAVMDEIRNSPVGRFLGDAYNPTTITLPIAAAAKIIPRILELGYFCEVSGDVLSIHTSED